MKPFKIVIRGGKPLIGRIAVSGAKNAALPCLAGALLTSQPCSLQNIPQVEDVRNLLLTLAEIGAEHEMMASEVRLQVPSIKAGLVSREKASLTRASILCLGPLLVRNGHARIAFPGGCSIGERKINYHLEGLQRMGARIETSGDYIEAEAEKLKGIEYRFPAKTVTGTENLIMAAVLAEGTTVLANCALEPEVADLATLLVKMGADISGIGSETMIIVGRSSLHGARHEIIPDRIEAGTYLLAGCFNGNRVELEKANPGHLSALCDVLQEIGFAIRNRDGSFFAERAGPLRPVRIQTEPYPGFPTDLQAQLTTLLTQIAGESSVVETIFNDRFKHINELNRLGADITVRGDTARIRGATPLVGARIRTTDLRASAALVLGGLIARGETTIENALQLLRGYENMADKLQKLGADITIVE